MTNPSLTIPIHPNGMTAAARSARSTIGGRANIDGVVAASAGIGLSSTVLPAIAARTLWLMRRKRDSPRGHISAAPASRKHCGISTIDFRARRPKGASARQRSTGLRHDKADPQSVLAPDKNATSTWYPATGQAVRSA
jgi:hypothetical protein